jgi:trans-aconitate 2-methyltransferase
VRGDLGTFAPQEGSEADVLFSNAVFHWLRNRTRIATLSRLFQTLRPGGVVAIQLPDNYEERSHRLMRETAVAEGEAWSKYFADAQVGNLQNAGRPDLDPVEPAGTFYNALAPHAASVNIWRTEYQHVLKDAKAIVEWVKGTGLQPYLQRIEDEEAKNAFLGEYEKRLGEAYPEMADGNVLLTYPRLFVVAVRK